jgi:hypothetical protein
MLPHLYRELTNLSLYLQSQLLPNNYNTFVHIHTIRHCMGLVIPERVRKSPFWFVPLPKNVPLYFSSFTFSSGFISAIYLFIYFSFSLHLYISLCMSWLFMLLSICLMCILTDPQIDYYINIHLLYRHRHITHTCTHNAPSASSLICLPDPTSSVLLSLHLVFNL